MNIFTYKRWLGLFFLGVVPIITLLSLYSNVWDTIGGVFNQVVAPTGEVVQFCDPKLSKPNSSLPATFDAYSSAVPDQIKTEDKEGYLDLIKKNAPIIYLHSDEIYLPVWANEYFTSASTSIGKKIVIPTGSATVRNLDEVASLFAPNGARGTITFEKIYYDFYKKKDVPDGLCIRNNTCMKFGSNPNGKGWNGSVEIPNKDAQGNLTTPMYVVTSEKNDLLYIQYVYFYGYNGPYPIAGGIIQGSVFDFQNAHEGDIEHTTLEFDKNTKTLKRIYYGSHGKYEGFWLPVTDPLVEREDNRIVVYSAKAGHGCYPTRGTYVRIFGQANDHTNKGHKWVPKNLIRVYPDGDSRFDPKTMGWLYFKGDLGNNGVEVLGRQGWFPKYDATAQKDIASIGTTNGVDAGDMGRNDTPRRLWCAEGDDSCATSKAPNAFIPK